MSDLEHDRFRDALTKADPRTHSVIVGPFPAPTIVFRIYSTQHKENQQ